MMLDEILSIEDIIPVFEPFCLKVYCLDGKIAYFGAKHLP
jgi:hypothetical protein